MDGSLGMNRANVCGEPCVYLSVCRYRLTTRSKILHPTTYRASCDLDPGFTRSRPNCPSLRSGCLSLCWSLIWLVLDLSFAVVTDLLGPISKTLVGLLSREPYYFSSSRLELDLGLLSHGMISLSKHISFVRKRGGEPWKCLRSFSPPNHP